MLIETDSGAQIIPTDNQGRICLNMNAAEQHRCYVKANDRGQLQLLEQGGRQNKQLNMDDRNRTVMVTGPNGKMWFSVQNGNSQLFPRGVQTDADVIKGIETPVRDGNKGVYRTSHRKNYRRGYFKKDR